MSAVNTVRPSLRLDEALSSLTVESLKIIARRCCPTLPTRKAELIRCIEQALGSPEFLAQQLAQADPTTRLALAEAAYGDGSLDPARFKAKYGTAFKIPGRSPYSSFDYRRIDSASVADLFFYDGRIPSDLIRPLQLRLPPPPPFTLPSAEALPTEVSGLRGVPAPLSTFLTEESALHDLVSTLALTGEGKVAIGAATSQPTLTTVRALRGRFLLADVVPPEETTSAEDSIRAFALTMIVQAAGLARARAGRLELTKAGRAALAAPSPALLKTCWEAWIASDRVDELSRVRGLKGQKARGQRLSRPSERKEAIDRALADSPPGVWIDARDFFRLIRVKHDFDVDLSDYSRLYVGHSLEDGWMGYAGTDVWEAVNAAYIRVILLEYAATLGLIDVATIPVDLARLDFHTDADVDATEFSRYGGLAYFRVNNLGRFILGQSESYEGPATLAEEAALTVLPSLDVVVADRANLPPNDRAMLERFTTRVSDDVYRLSKESLLEALEGGLSPSDAEAFLQRRGLRELPQTARVLFDDAARAAQAVRPAGPALLVECADTHVATLISHDSALARLCLAAGDRHLVVRQAELAAFRRGLRRLGFALPG